MVATNKASRPSDHQGNDFLQLLIQTQQKYGKLLVSLHQEITHQLRALNSLLGITNENFLSGHSFTTFSEGTETSSMDVCYALYELAKNPDSQEKLYKEIK